MSRLVERGLIKKYTDIITDMLGYDGLPERKYIIAEKEIERLMDANSREFEISSAEDLEEYYTYWGNVILFFIDIEYYIWGVIENNFQEYLLLACGAPRAEEIIDLEEVIEYIDRVMPKKGVEIKECREINKEQFDIITEEQICDVFMDIVAEVLGGSILQRYLKGIEEGSEKEFTVDSEGVRIIMNLEVLKEEIVEKSPRYYTINELVKGLYEDKDKYIQ